MVNNELFHHGIKGQKWGIRRFQPYSTVPRGSGKVGKETGAALKAAKKTAKRESDKFSKILATDIIHKVIDKTILPYTAPALSVPIAMGHSFIRQKFMSQNGNKKLSDYKK